MPLRLLDGKSPAFRAGASFSIEAGSKIEARGLFRDGRLEGARRIQGEGAARHADAAGAALRSERRLSPLLGDLLKVK
jgi:hypothetical protein